MKIVKTVLGAILTLIGAIWVLQGSNIITGSGMSGQSLWLYIGIVVALAGVAILYLTYRPRP
jgi:hypothetical protein